MINSITMWCYDNEEGDAFASSCNEDPAVAYQSTEVPVVLDLNAHYGEHVCGRCAMDADGIYFCEEGWTPDDQCDEVNWLTFSSGLVTAKWIMGGLPSEVEQGSMALFTQSLRVSLPQRPEVPAQLITGAAHDLPAHDMVPIHLSLSSRVNAPTQYAGASMERSFRTVIL